MPDTVCPRCQQAGFVRSETIIRAGAAYQSLYCGRCDHSWRSGFKELSDERRDITDEKPEPSRPKPPK